MYAIKTKNLNKHYTPKKGLFDISISIKPGEVYGYLGPNGAGKSTTMRHLMGFVKPDSGYAEIIGLNCWKKQKEIQKHVGYLPGEISFPEDISGIKYLKLIAQMRNMNDFSYAQELIEYFQLDPNGKIGSMSKGMKQKIGIVAAFMHKPDILLLDEPTSGLDPLMQNRFIELMEKMKSNGKTILLSSHIFEEVEKTCDRIGIIRNGKLIDELTVDELRHSQFKTFNVEFNDGTALESIKLKFPESEFRKEQNQVIFSINDSDTNKLIRELSKYDIKFITEKKHTLEEYFMKFYGGDENA